MGLRWIDGTIFCPLVSSVANLEGWFVKWGRFAVSYFKGVAARPVALDPVFLQLGGKRELSGHRDCEGSLKTVVAKQIVLYRSER